jgi:predicted membrane-bound mannosyltransferase
MRKKDRIAELEKDVQKYEQIVDYWKYQSTKTRDSYDQLVNQLETILRGVKQ